MTESSRVWFLEEYWRFCRKKNWEVIVLHDWEKIPHNIESDIDYAIRGLEPSDFVQELIGFCEARGWRLVQILEHEVDALYCVCISCEPPFESLSLDVCWDYRRKGIDLINRNILFKQPRGLKGRDFKIPSEEVEFLYRLVKAAAKGKDLGSLPELEGRLVNLFNGQPERCTALLADVCDYRGPEEWDSVREFFCRSPFFDRARHSRKLGLREIRLYWKRMWQPTGLRLSHSNGLVNLPRIVKAIGPAFRRVQTVSKDTGFLKVRWMLVRSCLVVQENVEEAGRDVVDLGISQDEKWENLVCKVIDAMAARIRRYWKVQAKKKPAVMQNHIAD
jgi:hypothetical protein